METLKHNDCSITFNENKAGQIISCRIQTYYKNEKIRKTFKITEVATTKIKKQACAYADELRNSLESNGLNYLKAESTTFEEYAEVWKEEVGKEELTTRTFEDYCVILRNRINPIIGKMYLTDIRPAHLQHLIQTYRKDNLAIATIKKNILVCNAVLKHAYHMELITDEPYRKIKITDKKKKNEEVVEENEQIKFFNKEQAVAFLNFVRTPTSFEYGERTRTDSHGNTYTVKPYTTEHVACTQWNVYYTIAIGYGLRRGEMLALKWSDINFKDNTIKITKAFDNRMNLKAPKTKSSIRNFALDDSTISLLKTWKKEQKELCLKLGTKWRGTHGTDYDNNYIFIQMDSGLPMNIYSPYKKFISLCKQYNSTCKDRALLLPEITLHDLRHTFATIALSEEHADLHSVSYILGHAEVSITLNIYGHYIRKNVNDVSVKVARSINNLLAI